MRSPKLSTDELQDREYLTPQQVARILGRSRAFWAQAFDSGQVNGYTQRSPGGRKYRYLKVSSARALIEQFELEEQMNRKSKQDKRVSGNALKRFSQRISGETL